MLFLLLHEHLCKCVNKKKYVLDIFCLTIHWCCHPFQSYGDAKCDQVLSFHKQILRLSQKNTTHWLH